MSENASTSGSSSLNWTSVATLLTLLGGLFIVSKSVWSDRPNPAATPGFSSIGIQRMQARLWEDPLGTNDMGGAESAVSNSLSGAIGLDMISHQHPTLLVVMSRGGPYSEEHESRIRGRYAVVSALGEAGYVPEDVEHIGWVSLPWPTTPELENAPINLANTTSTNFARLRATTPTPSLNVVSSNSVASINATTAVSDSTATNSSNIDSGLRLEYFPMASKKLNLAFEWYRSRVFNQGSDPGADQHVLLLWLDENEFGDHPQVRLTLLLNELAATNLAAAAEPIAHVFKSVALIGPRSSDELRAMLPPYGNSASDSNDLVNRFRQPLTDVLKHVDIFCAIPSAMDEVLVKSAKSSLPRQPVENALTNWFHSFHNFCSTDAQLAHEALDELSLRRIDLGTLKRRKNLVLISEWDTFYGRMLSLTYAAELAVRQNQCSDDMDFITGYLNGTRSSPDNLRSFVYLRGLDGQSTHPTALTSSETESRKSNPWADLKYGNTTLQKAQGEAQYDYLTRLGDEMLEWQAELQAQGKGRVDAVGIVGSDVYDSVVILQSLRPKFRDAVFFTTGLDARFLHPEYQEATRNVLVFGSYGLQLRKNLQGGVPPFRDGEQTAQFAATLAALTTTNSHSSALLALTNIPPRRFEIGRLQAYDLSVTTAGVLQPDPPAQRDSVPKGKYLLIFLALALGTCLLVWFSRTLQYLTTDHKDFEIGSLWFQMEDVGDQHGLSQLLDELRMNRSDSLVSWLLDSYGNAKPSKKSPVEPKESPSLDELQNFLDFMNGIALQTRIPPEAVSQSEFVNHRTKEEFQQFVQEKRGGGGSLKQSIAAPIYLRRQIFSDLFTNVFPRQTAGFVETANRKTISEVARAHEYSREAGLAEYRLRRNWRRTILLGFAFYVAIFGCLLWTAIADTYSRASGEPLLFSAGISIWPTEILRLLAIFLSVAFLANAYDSLRSGVFELTRTYRLPLAHASCQFRFRLPSLTARQATIDANDIWQYYQQLGRFWQRAGRVAPLWVIYLLFCCAIGVLGGIPYSPGRGTPSFAWDTGLLWIMILAFLFLTFWIIDACCLCRWLIEHLSEAPTRYPDTCLQFFARQRSLGELNQLKEGDRYLLAEWIDMQLIATLTEHVGRLVYYPAIIFFIIFISRNNWWDRWTWPAGLVIVFGFNMFLALASIIILQKAARKAQTVGVKNLQARVEAAEQEAAPDPKTHRAAIARQLLQEVQTLNNGAFAPFWDNPIIGALLIPSGGSVLIELLLSLFG